MRKLFAKKQLMMVALVAALGVAVYLNYYLSTEPSLEAGATASDTSQEDGGTLGEATFVGATVSTTTTTAGSGTTGTTTVAGADYFDTARHNRTAAREQALSILQEVLDNTGATAEEQAANAAGYFHALSAATTVFVVTCDGKPVEGGAYVSLYDPASETFPDSTCLPPQRSGYIELVCTVPTGWQVLSVTYTPTFVSGKSLTFPISASDVAKG